MTESKIARKAKTSLLWSGVERFSTQGIGFVVTLVISRLVDPSDYGLIAMIAIFIAVSQVLVDSGISNSLIQNARRTEVDYSTVFYINLAIGLFCYAVLYIGAPCIAGFYGQPALCAVTRVYALALIVSSVTLVQRTRFLIEFRYRQLGLISIASILFSGILAVCLAYYGYGVWALVSYFLVQSSVAGVLTWMVSRWRPRFVFSKKSAIHALDFGSKLLAANLLHSIVSNIYTLVIGKKYNAVDLGYYGRSQSIANIYPSNISNMIAQAAYPVLCELQEDESRLKALFVNYIRTVSILSFPMMALLVALAEPAVSFLLGEKWLPAVFFVRILAVGSMLDPVMRLNAVILSVTGRTKYALWSEILKKIVLISLLLVSLPFGLKWVTAGAAFYSVCDLFTVSFFTRRIIPFSFWEELCILSPYLAFAAAAGTVTFVLSEWISPDWLSLLVGVPVGLGLYAGLVRIFIPDQFRRLAGAVRSIWQRA